jgi:hypothetical protein
LRDLEGKKSNPQIGDFCQGHTTGWESLLQVYGYQQRGLYREIIGELNRFAHAYMISIHMESGWTICWKATMNNTCFNSTLRAIHVIVRSSVRRISAVFSDLYHLFSCIYPATSDSRDVKLAKITPMYKFSVAIAQSRFNPLCSAHLQ